MRWTRLRLPLRTLRGGARGLIIEAAVVMAIALFAVGVAALVNWLA